MKCPLKFRLTDYGAEVERIFTGDCLKEECAFWTDGEEGCVIQFIEKDLAGIWALLTTIANKMPHARQFVK